MAKCAIDSGSTTPTKSETLNIRSEKRAQRATRFIFNLKERRLEDGSLVCAARAEARTEEKRKQVVREKWREKRAAVVEREGGELCMSSVSPDADVTG